MAFWRKSKPDIENESASFTDGEGVVDHVQALSEKGELRLGVLKRPMVTEKASRAAEKNKYLFAVADKANKIDVKRAVENRFGVKVKRVHINRMPGKVRRRGRVIGWKSGFKKAEVTLTQGEKIEFT